MEKIIGVVGGMGPLATLDFYRKIIEETLAKTDQDHPRVLIDSNAKIPDRTSFLLGQGPDPRPAMKSTVEGLVGMGAQVLTMPCNTAHAFYEELTCPLKGEGVVFLHMIEEVARAAKEQGVESIFLLSTEGTFQSGIYQRVFDREELAVIAPSKGQREKLMEAIYRVKAGKLTFDGTFFHQLVEASSETPRQALVLGCTELPLVFQALGLSNTALDPTRILARRAVELSKT